MTSDDIVTRLRHQWTGEYDPTGKMLAEAGDEIERLRAQVDSTDAVAYRSLKNLYDKQYEQNTLLLEQRDRAWAEYYKLKDARIDLQAVKNIVGSVQDLLLAVRRQHDTQLIQQELIASKDAEIERLRDQVDKLHALLDDANERLSEVLIDEASTTPQHPVHTIHIPEQGAP